MTKARTRFKPKSYSEGDSPTPMLMLDGFGQLNVIVFDNIDLFTKQLGISENKQVLFSDLVNVNLVYGFAEKMGIQPGLFIEGDQALIQYIQASISDNVVDLDRKLVIEELQASWLRVHQHPLTKPYLPMGSPLCVDNGALSPHFPAIPGFDVFQLDYYSGLVELFVQSKSDSFARFVQLTHILYCSHRCLGYQNNYFLQMNHLISQLEESRNLVTRDAEVLILLTQAKKLLQDQKGVWFEKLVWWVKGELIVGDIAEDYPQECGQAMTNLLEGRLPLSTNVNLCESLKELLNYFTWPEGVENKLLRACGLTVTGQTAIDFNKLSRAAVEFGILEYASAHNIAVYEAPEFPQTHPFLLAGQGKEAEQRLLAFLLESENMDNLTPFELFAIARKSQNSMVQELVQDKISTKANLEKLATSFRGLSLGYAASIPSVGAFMLPRQPTFTPLWTRVESALKGGTQNRKAVVFRSFVIGFDKPPPLEPETPAPNMDTILNLKAPGVGTCQLL